MTRADDPEAEMVREAWVCSPDEEGNQTKVTNPVSGCFHRDADKAV